MDSRRNISVQSIASLTCLTVALFVLLALAVWLCHQSGYQLSPTGLSRLSVHDSHESGTIYWLIRRLLSRCLFSHRLKTHLFARSFPGYFPDVKLPSWISITPSADLPVVRTTYRPKPVKNSELLD